ncbi:MAG TPA: GGDEF domain-containing protein [Solirubrobacterales bacterium]|nr:GGDEF domain-containing protein [Solirubrobacterales bacterium]
MAGSWLIDDGLDRERMLDMDRRIAPVRRRTFAVLAVALLACGPWLGWWTIAPLLGAGVLFAAADRVTKRMRRPELGLFAAWAGAEAIVAISVALSGGPEVATLSWLAIPVVTLASRFSIRGIVAGVTIALALLGAVAFGGDAAAVLDEPPLVVAPAALIVSVAMLSTALMRSDLEFRSRSVIDPLTGMLNRSALAARVGELSQQSAISGHPVSLVLADVDEFKALNDSHGHSTGDAVLRDLAYRLRKRMRAFDLAYRIGGEEFLLVLPGSEPAEAVAFADQLCAAIAAEEFGGIRVTLSCGVAASAPGSTFQYEEVFAAADTALYEAKRSGRNCVCAAPVLVGAAIGP